MSDIFVSYTRADRRLARRVRDGLASLGMNVLWDESMPAVDWQEYLENSIQNIVAVVVIWTPQSSSSGSVRDEARLALESDKLVNIVSDVAKPRFPYDRINGLSIDGWVAGIRHSGWARIVSTLDARLAAAGAIQAGSINNALSTQLQEVTDRKREIAQIEKDVARLTRAAELAGTDAAAAHSQFAIAEGQLDNLKGITATKSVMAAAWADRDEAKTELTLRQKALAEASSDLTQAEDRLRDTSAKLAEYMVSIGAPPPGEDVLVEEAEDTPQDSVEDQASPEEDRAADVVPEPPVADDSLPERPEDDSVFVTDPIEGKLVPPPDEPETPIDLAEEPVKKDDPAGGDTGKDTNIRGLLDKPQPHPQPQPKPDPDWNRLLLRVGLPLAGVLALILVIALMLPPPRPNDDTIVTNNSSIVVDPTPTDPATLPPAPDPSRSVSPAAWIVGTWGVGKGSNNCGETLTIRLSDDQQQLIFSSTTSTQPSELPFTIASSDTPGIQTADYRYSQVDATHMRVIGLKNQPSVELEKCDTGSSPQP